MFDFWRNLTRSAAARRQEYLNAYLDDALSAGERRRLESQLANDAELQAELNQLRLLKQSLRQLPIRRVPRNFTLDPALYGRPQPRPLFQTYPVLRAATVMTAFFFILTVAFSAFTGSGGFPAMGVAELVRAPARESAPAMAEEAASEIALEAEPAEEGAQPFFQAPVESTRVVELETADEAIIAAEVVVTAEMEAAAPVAEAGEDVAEEASTVIAEEEVGLVAPAEMADDGESDSARATVNEGQAETAAEQEVAAEAAAEPSVAVVEATPAAAATASAVPTATRSVTPREEPAATIVSDRALVETAADEADTDAAAAGSEAEPASQSLETLSQPGRFLAGLAGLQLALGVAFVVLAALTLLARRRRR